jgi:predicted DNA-binding ribbon-helix-helix protein
MTQDRTESGQFAPKSNDYRHVRSIRLTDETWEKIGYAAEAQKITRADLIEQMAEDGVFEQLIAPATVPDSSQLLAAVESVMSNPDVTRKGKDKGAVKRALEALLSHLGIGK